MMRIALIALVAGCIDPASVPCGDVYCPSGTTCRALTNPDENVCATPGQVKACASAAEGATCDTGWCHDGVCLPIECGNGRVDLTEACDDSNTVSGDGTCSANCASTEQCGNHVVDALAVVDNVEELNEECDDGNLVTGDGCSSRCEAELDRWSLIDTAKPPPMWGASLAYDAARRRLVMFGGAQIAVNYIVTNTTYEWDGAAWISIPTRNAPSARAFATMAYDATRRRIVLFGGSADGSNPAAALGDTWSWDGVEWTPISTSPSPSPRSRHAMVYDSARRVIVLFGGTRLTDLDDTWELDGNTWTDVSTTNRPCARYGHAMAYDPNRALTVLVGGTNDGSHGCTPSNTLERGSGAWTQTTASTPIVFFGAAMAYEPQHSRMLLYGGEAVDGASMSDATYQYSSSQWTLVGDASPDFRARQAMATDWFNKTIVMFGGAFEGGSNDTMVDETWIWNGDTWTLASDPVRPTPDVYRASTADPLRGVTWVFGGQTEGDVITNELWSFDGSRWRSHVPSGGPSARLGAAMAFDEARGEVILFGGGISNSVGLADTWRWNGLQWSSTAPANSPPARALHGMAYDASRKRVVLHGGAALSSGSPTELSDTWEWDGSNWQPVLGATAPPVRFGTQISYDAKRGKIVLAPAGTLAGDFQSNVWTYDSAGWVSGGVTGIAARLGSMFTYVPGQQRSIIYGGAAPRGGAWSDTWSIASTTQQVLLEQQPSPRFNAVSFSSRDGAAALLHGGSSGSSQYNELWQLRYHSSSPFEQCAISVDNDADGLAGCADPDCWATCAPLCPPGAPCDASASRCGDMSCNASIETCRSCAVDCGACAPVCGDTFCDAGETMASCPGDCTP